MANVDPDTIENREQGQLLRMRQLDGGLCPTTRLLLLIIAPQIEPMGEAG